MSDLKTTQPCEHSQHAMCIPSLGLGSHLSFSVQLTGGRLLIRGMGYFFLL